MKLKRTLTVTLTQDQADTLNALGFLHRRRWTDQARDALDRWLCEEARDPNVVAAKRAVREYQGRPLADVIDMEDRRRG
jgi:hypothetical protein